jgi:hypothetical protein
MANQLTVKDRIDYLVQRRFPLAYMLSIRPSIASSNAPLPDTRQLRSEIETFRNELAAFTYEELVARYEEAKRQEFEQLRAKAEEEDRRRFYNQPGARADFDHWAKAAHWTLDEAIALSFGRAPEVVKWEKLKSLTQLGSPFVFQYARRRDLALRAAAWQLLFDPVLPGIFLAWAKRTDIEIAPELIAAVESRGVQVADWKKLYENALAQREKDKAAHASQIADWKRLYEELRITWESEHTKWLKIVGEKNETLAALQERVASLEISSSETADIAAPIDGKSIGTRERDTLLKLIIGMARDSYNYDPKLNRSSVPQEIADDLTKHGISIDVDTVRKWLKQAAEFLPGE